mmetsp:Transcript_14871/g.30026  ORF Transcript_14871/g.30026 Transcript_14871/m.30026 type:complete len:100 (-) Transcript_14871:245-544(-)
MFHSVSLGVGGWPKGETEIDGNRRRERKEGRKRGRTNDNTSASDRGGDFEERPIIPPSSFYSSPFDCLPLLLFISMPNKPTKCVEFILRFSLRFALGVF